MHYKLVGYLKTGTCPLKFRERSEKISFKSLHSNVYLVFWKMAEQRKEGEDGQLLMREGIHELSESQEKQHQPNTLN